MSPLYRFQKSVPALRDGTVEPLQSRPALTDVSLRQGWALRGVPVPSVPHQFPTPGTDVGLRDEVAA